METQNTLISQNIIFLFSFVLLLVLRRLLMILPLACSQYKKNALVCQQYITAKLGLISILGSLRLLEILPKRSYTYFED
jgi:hypothetical protein